MSTASTARWLSGLNEYLKWRDRAAELEDHEIDCTCDADNFHTCDICRESRAIASRMRVLIDCYADNWAVLIPEMLEALKQSLRLPTLLVRSYEDVDGSHQSAKTARQFDERYRALRAQIEAVIAKAEGCS